MIFNKHLMNIFYNFIQKKILILNINKLINNELTNKYYKYRKTKSHFNELQEKTDKWKILIFDTKEKYISCINNNFNDPLTALKTYWSILNRFLNNKKLLALPPRFLKLFRKS